MKRLVNLFVFSFFIIAIEGPFRHASVAVLTEKGEISGQVLDKITKEPIWGASIKLLKDGKSTGRGVLTDSMGNFTLRDIPVDTYEIEISYTDYFKRQLKNLKVKANQMTKLGKIMWLLQNEIFDDTTVFKWSWLGYRPNLFSWKKWCVQFQMDSNRAETNHKKSNFKFVENLGWILRKKYKFSVTKDSAEATGFIRLLPEYFTDGRFKKLAFSIGEWPADPKTPQIVSNSEREPNSVFAKMVAFSISSSIQMAWSSHNGIPDGVRR